MLHFIRISSSWLNLIERWFAELSQKAVRRGVFRSVDELQRAIAELLTAWNAAPAPLRVDRQLRGQYQKKLLAPAAGSNRSRLTPHSPNAAPAPRPTDALRLEISLVLSSSTYADPIVGHYTSRLSDLARYMA